MASINTQANVVLNINGREATRVLTDAQNKARQLKAAIDAASKAGDTQKLKKLQRELKGVEATIRQVQSSSKSAEQVLRRLDKATPNELNKTLRTLNSQLKNIERGSAAWDAQTAKIRAVKAELDKCKAATSAIQTPTDRLFNGFNKMAAGIAAAGAAVTGLIMAGKAAVKSFAEMDEQIANTRKFTGMTEQQVKELNDEFKNMDTRLAREQLNELAQEAGRLGKSSKEAVIDYVKAASVINVALSDLGEGATQKIAKLANIFKAEELYGTYDAMMKIGSTVNVLSQNCTASKPYLVEFAARMAGVGSQAGIAITDIMGFAAVLDANAQKVESSATAISQVLTRMFKDPTKYAKAAGMEVAEFSKLLKEDANGALMVFLESLNKAGGMDVLAPMFKDMGENGARCISALSTLAGHIDEVRWQQENATKAFEEGTSALHEYEIFNNTTQAKLEKASKVIQELKIELGEKLLPVMGYFKSSGVLTLKVLNQLVTFFINYRGMIISTTAAIAAYVIAINLATIKTAAHTAVTAAATIATKAWRAIQLLAAAATAVMEGNTIRATAAMRAFDAATKANSIGLLVSGIALLVGWLITLANKENDAAEATKNLSAREKDLAEIKKAGNKAYEEEERRVKKLIEVASSEYTAKEKRLSAIKSLNEIIPNYCAHIDDETGRYRASTRALNDYLYALKEKAELETGFKMLGDINEQRNNAELEFKMAQQKYEELVIRKASGFSSTEEGRNISMVLHEIDATMAKAGKTINDMDERERILRLALPGLDEFEKNKYLEESVNNDTSEDFGPTELPEITENTTGKGRFSAEKEQKERSEAMARIARATGRIIDESGNESLYTYRDYLEDMMEAQETYYEQVLNRTDISENERASITAEYYDMLTKYSGDFLKDSASSLSSHYDELLAELKQSYIDGTISQETMQQESERLEIEHQSRLVQLYDEGSDERIAAEKRLTDLLVKEAERRRKETEKKEAELAKIKADYFGDNHTEAREKAEAALSLLDTVYSQEIAKAGDVADEKLRIEEAYQKARLAIMLKYGLITQQEYDRQIESYNQTQSEHTDAVSGWLASDTGNAVTKSFDALVSGMGSIMSGLSSLISAELELQEAAIERRYDKELSLAEGNSYKVAQAEKKKEKEIAKVKADASRKQYSMQVIMAVAQTAQNALAAYGSAAAIPLVGYILAPIAAAMAVAAGAVQIAAIKKQQQSAESTGYSEGGFTKKGAVDEPAGVVHAGEWVASQRLVNSPQARPLINALEYAQRTNNMAVLDKTDVSSSISAPARLASAYNAGLRQSSITATEFAETSSILKKLSDKLEEPFVTVNTITGDHGIKHAYDEYDALIRNKTPKSRR